jgi:hypothetical protein
VVDITAGKLQFIPVANAHGTPYASFTFQVQDNGGTANGGANTDPTVNTITINVTSIDDPPVCPNDAATIDEDTDLIAKKLTDVEIMETSPPVVTTSIGTTTFTTKCGPVVVDNQVIVTDPDSSTIASATIKITNVKNGAAESLDVDLTGLPVITKTTSRTDGTFTLTLTGPASRVTFRSVLRRVTYNNNSNDVNLDNRVIQFQVSDGHSNSNTAVKTVLVVEAVDD